MIAGKLPFRGKDIATAVQQLTPVFYATMSSHPRKNAAEALASELLCKNPISRLGSKNYTDIINHTYFQDVDFDKLTVVDMPLTTEELDVRFVQIFPLLPRMILWVSPKNEGSVPFFQCIRIDVNMVAKEEGRTDKPVALPQFTSLHATHDQIERSPLFSYVSETMKEAPSRSFKTTVSRGLTNAEVPSAEEFEVTAGSFDLR